MLFAHVCLSQDVKLLIEDVGELKPTIFCAVPRVLDRVYSGISFGPSLDGYLKMNLSMGLINPNLLRSVLVLQYSPPRSSLFDDFFLLDEMYYVLA